MLQRSISEYLLRCNLVFVIQGMGTAKEQDKDQRVMMTGGQEKYPTLHALPNKQAVAIVDVTRSELGLGGQQANVSALGMPWDWLQSTLSKNLEGRGL